MSQLRESSPWGERISRRPDESWVRLDPSEADSAGVLLELRPPAELQEVPVWVRFEHGLADLSEIEFEPVAVSVVRWGVDHAERGLIAGFPQMLLGPALAGRSRRKPVAGGRRADGSLELWIEPSGTGEALAAVDADPRLGDLADLRWQTEAGDGRLLIALVSRPTGRSTGLARVPVDPALSFLSLEILLVSSLGAIEADPDLLARSAASARSKAGRERWDRLLSPIPARAHPAP